jgi:phosphoribosylamine--glycine ligase
MRVLLLGSGGRESALAAALDKAPSVSELIAAPGNPGIAEFATTVVGDLAAPDATVALAAEIDADLVVVGPEAPLVAGVADALIAVGAGGLRPLACSGSHRGVQGVRQGAHGARGHSHRPP